MRWIDELPDLARAALPAPVFDYLAQGAGAQLSTGEAVAAWDRYRFRPRVLRGVGAVTTATSLLGTPVGTPIGVAPTTLQGVIHPDGEVATAAGVARAGSLLVVSSNTGVPFERLAGVAAPWWLQVYVLRDRELTADVVRRAVAAGARAVVLTADTPVVGTKPPPAGRSVWAVVPPGSREANVRAAGYPAGATDKATDLTPDTIGWLAELTGLPVVVKGVLRGDDARAVVGAGAAAVWVSNHGGRQLDLAVPTAVALGEVTAAVRDTGAEVYVDGGIRRGGHVLAALALGARAVFLGRLPAYALALPDGPAAVSRLLADLTAELAEAMLLAGVPAPDRVGADLLAGAGR